MNSNYYIFPIIVCNNSEKDGSIYNPSNSMLGVGAELDPLTIWLFLNN